MVSPIDPKLLCLLADTRVQESLDRGVNGHIPQSPRLPRHSFAHLTVSPISTTSRTVTTNLIFEKGEETRLVKVSTPELRHLRVSTLLDTIFGGISQRKHFMSPCNLRWKSLPLSIDEFDNGSQDEWMMDAKTLQAADEIEKAYRDGNTSISVPPVATLTPLSSPSKRPIKVTNVANDAIRRVADQRRDEAATEAAASNAARGVSMPAQLGERASTPAQSVPTQTVSPGPFDENTSRYAYTPPPQTGYPQTTYPAYSPYPQLAYPTYPPSQMYPHQAYPQNGYFHPPPGASTVTFHPPPESSTTGSTVMPSGPSTALPTPGAPPITTLPRPPATTTALPTPGAPPIATLPGPPPTATLPPLSETSALAGEHPTASTAATPASSESSPLPDAVAGSSAVPANAEDADETLSDAPGLDDDESIGLTPSPELLEAVEEAGHTHEGGRPSKKQLKEADNLAKEIDAMIQKASFDTGLTTHYLYRHYALKTQHARARTNWNMYQTYVKADENKATEMSSLDSTVLAWDGKSKITAKQVLAAYKNFIALHGKDDARRILELWTALHEVTTYQTRGERKRSVETIKDQFLALATAAHNRYGVNIWAIGAGGMLQADQANVFIIQPFASEGFGASGFLHDDESLAVLFQSYVYNKVAVNYTNQQVAALANERGLVITGPGIDEEAASTSKASTITNIKVPVASPSKTASKVTPKAKAVPKAKATPKARAQTEPPQSQDKTDARLAVLERLNETVGPLNTRGHLPWSTIANDCLSQGVQILNYPLDIPLPWQVSGARGIKNMDGRHQATIVQQCNEGEMHRLTFESVEPLALAAGDIPLLARAPDKTGNVERHFAPKIPGLDIDVKQVTQKSKVEGKKVKFEREATAIPDTPTASTGLRFASRNKSRPTYREEDEVDELSEAAGSEYDGSDTTPKPKKNGKTTRKPSKIKSPAFVADSEDETMGDATTSGCSAPTTESISSPAKGKLPPITSAEIANAGFQPMNLAGPSKRPADTSASNDVAAKKLRCASPIAPSATPTGGAIVPPTAPPNAPVPPNIPPSTHATAESPAALWNTPGSHPPLNPPPAVQQQPFAPINWQGPPYGAPPHSHHHYAPPPPGAPPFYPHPHMQVPQGYLRPPPLSSLTPEQAALVQQYLGWSQVQQPGPSGHQG
ncbi:hypothetical protein V5O48_012539 [Marasmius crinis-equi]|uniref:Uncharacterized protein n=1 Tax=Marasmius crinis-equi TaxID=585013 RepID=A0ABR3F2K5_9AGAR